MISRELLRSVSLVLPLCCNPALPTENRMWARNASPYVIYSFLVTAFKKKNKWNLFYYYISQSSVSKIAFQQVTDIKIIELFCILFHAKSLKCCVHHALNRASYSEQPHMASGLGKPEESCELPSRKNAHQHMFPITVRDSWTPGSYLGLPVIKEPQTAQVPSLISQFFLLLSFGGSINYLKRKF